MPGVKPRQLHPHPEELLEFPWDYIVKAVGHNDPPGAFVAAGQATVGETVTAPLDALKVRPSGQGTYACVSVVVRLHTFEQLKNIYAALRQVEGIRYVL